MTPFGAKMRELRAARELTLKRMAEDLQISAAYLSALEHGKRGRPRRMLVLQIATYFELGWEEQEELDALVRLSDPRVTVDTAGLPPKTTELANEFARRIRHLPEATIDRLLQILRNDGKQK
ncbi:MAG: helix-turn-helix domain-containing protein [Alphaproteobacteria bacterium]|nr:helix-turn-helix domain-containing protein [Alphaproteobacteria bacterium]